jgi:hypothetical protein
MGATKKSLEYKYVDSITDECRLKWSKAKGGEIIYTILGDELETKNIANPGDYIICGPVGEKYVVTTQKIGKLYEILENGNIQSKSDTRSVAQYVGGAGYITTSWGAKMVINTGDYVVKEDSDKYYRIKGSIFETTYDWIPVLTAKPTDRLDPSKSPPKLINDYRTIRYPLPTKTSTQPPLTQSSSSPSPWTIWNTLVLLWRTNASSTDGRWRSVFP